MDRQTAWPRTCGSVRDFQSISSNSLQRHRLQHHALRSEFTLRVEAGPLTGSSAFHEPQMSCLWRLPSWTVRCEGSTIGKRHASRLSSMRHLLNPRGVATPTELKLGWKHGQLFGGRQEPVHAARTPVSRPPPYINYVAEHIGGLEEVAERCRMTEVS